MIAQIQIGKYYGLVLCYLFNGEQFTISWINYGNFPKHWHGLRLCHKNHIVL